jgi:hypothetical protein
MLFHVVRVACFSCADVPLMYYIRIRDYASRTLTSRAPSWRLSTVSACRLNLLNLLAY